MAISSMPILGQIDKIVHRELSDGQTNAVKSSYYSLPEKEGFRYIVSEGDTVWEQKDSLVFSQALLVESIKRNAVEKVCGVSFGTPYEFTRYALEKQFGSPVYLASQNILYKNVVYEGEFFNDISFLFHQKDNDEDYLSQIVFLKTANSLDDALLMKDKIEDMFSSKYPSIHGLSEELTVGGLPPASFQGIEHEKKTIDTAVSGFGFEIKIVFSGRPETPYYVRIMFGPYEYQKEDSNL